MSLKTFLLSLLFYGSTGTATAQELLLRELVGNGDIATTATKDSIIRCIGAAYAESSNSQEQAVNALLPLLRYSKKIHFNAGTGVILIHLANFKNSSGDLTEGLALLGEAKYYCQWSAQYDKRYGQRSLILWYNAICSYYSWTAEYKKSLYYGLKGLDLLAKNEFSDPMLLIPLLANVGSLYSRFGEPDKALMYYKEAEQQARKNKEEQFLPFIINGQGGVFMDLKQYDTAYTLFLSALDHMGERPDPVAEQRIYVNLVATLLQKKNYKRAGLYLEKAVANKDNIALPADISIFFYYTLGQFYLYSKEFKQAEKAVLSAIDLAKKTKFSGYLDDYYAWLAEVYVATGDYKKAYAARELATAEHRKVLDKQQLQSVNELETKYQVLKKDKAIVEKNLLLLEGENKLKRKNLWFTGIAACVLFVFLIIAGWVMYDRRKEKLKFLNALIRGEENERTRIARELHDGVSQTIGSVKIRLMALEHELSPLLLSAPRASLSETIQLVDDCAIEVRQLSHDMMPRALGKSSLPVALEQLIAALNVSIPDIRLYLHGFTNKHYSPLIETSVYRIVQEGISNALRHAYARRLDISVLSSAKGLDIVIGDDGIGFDHKIMERSEGIGLKNISARVRLLQGKMELDTAPGKGARIVIYLPTPSREKRAAP